MVEDLASRCLLTGSYLCAAIAAGANMAVALVKWVQNLDCLPPVTDSFGDPLSVKNALGHACDIITYGSCTVCVLSLMIAISLNCCWGQWSWSLWNQMITVLMGTLSACCGTALTVDFMLWCHTLKNAVSDYEGCESAASLYDAIHSTSNMTTYFRKMEVQQACQWAVVPFLLFATVVYAFVMKAHAIKPLQDRHPLPRRYYLLPDETALLCDLETARRAPGRRDREGIQEQVTSVP